jgi:hypothetical protein
MAISQFISIHTGKGDVEGKFPGSPGFSSNLTPRIFFQPYSPDLLGKFLRDFIEVPCKVVVYPFTTYILHLPHWLL